VWLAAADHHHHCTRLRRDFPPPSSEVKLKIILKIIPVTVIGAYQIQIINAIEKRWKDPFFNLKK
jgi:hypothetical protein